MELEFDVSAITSRSNNPRRRSVPNCCSTFGATVKRLRCGIPLFCIGSQNSGHRRTIGGGLILSTSVPRYLTALIRYYRSLMDPTGFGLLQCGPEISCEAA